MTDLSTIRVIPFYGESKEWTTWSKKFLAKTKRYGFKDVSLGKMKISKADEDDDMELEGEIMRIKMIKRLGEDKLARNSTK
jgi:hypothetical protein